MIASKLRTSPTSSQFIGGYPIAWLESALTKLARQTVQFHGPARVDDLVLIGLQVAREMAAVFDPERGTFFAFIYVRTRRAMVEHCRRGRVPGADEVPPPSSLRAEPMRPRALLAPSALDALTDLSLLDKEIVVACAMHGVSIADVARRLGLPYEAARDCYRNALAQLQAAIDLPFNRAAGR